MKIDLTSRKEKKEKVNFFISERINKALSKFAKKNKVAKSLVVERSLEKVVNK